ncbi:hypothetical protein ACGFX2_14440 [Streptomyces goshikiensis]|uniref:hypothetical protein n=1 Tax=Streptomyces goshikiensis TaxID=1942 RepID=UPI003719C72C
MFIRPVGVTVSAAIRPAGHPLLRGLLARASAPTGTAAYGGGERLRYSERASDAYSEEAPYREPADARAYGEEPAYPEPADADEPDWAEAAEPPELAEPPEPAAAAGPGPGAVGRAAEPYAGLPSELAQLAALAREGLLTPEEFAAAKALLLHP